MMSFALIHFQTEPTVQDNPTADVVQTQQASVLETSDDWEDGAPCSLAELDGIFDRLDGIEGTKADEAKTEACAKESM